MSKPVIVGVLNVTPDSYFDGGLYTGVEKAVEHAGRMLREGADIIEVGGESTGPGSNDVSLDEELKRTTSVIDALRATFPTARLSIDTYKSVVAKEALARGVTMVNDVTAGRSDAKMFEILAASTADLVLMYAKDPTPRTTIEQKMYTDIVSEVSDFLMRRVTEAEAAGVERNRLMIDPGLGHFLSSNAQYSFTVLAHLWEFTKIAPVFISPSRKSFLAGDENLKTDERLPGTIAASSIAVLHGASYIRTHDVLQVRRACEIAHRIAQA